MMCKTVIYLLLLLPVAAWAQEVSVPAELIHQLFQADKPNREIPKRPFNFREFETLLSSPRFKDPAQAEDITRRYLAVTYPAGLTSAHEIARSELGDDVKEALFTAPSGSVRVAVPRDINEALGLLDLLSQKLAMALLAGSSAVVVHQLDKLDVIALLDISDRRFQKIGPFYLQNVTMYDAQRNRYLLSTPGSDHYLVRLLEGVRSKGIECSARIENCKDENCKTPSSGSSYASFQFKNKGHWYIEPGDAFTARCHYANTFRREYTDRLEIEYEFDRCELLTVNGERPVIDPLLQDLSKVQ